MPTALGIVASGRAVASAPPIPTTGLIGWWDAADAATITYSSGSNVSRWADKSPSGYHATNSNTGLHPLREAAVINGLPAIKFLGDVLQTSLQASTKPFTIIAVVRLAAITAAGLLGRSTTAESANGNFNIDLNASRFRLMRYSTAAVAQTTATVAVNTNVMIEVTYSATGVYAWYIDGIADATGTNNQTFVAATMSIGGHLGDSTSGTLQGHIGELVRYDRVIDATERQAVEAYLATKWGIAIPTPVLPTAGRVGWWDASDAASIVSSGGVVSQWNDKSGSDFHAVQATAARRPTTGTATRNGKNVLVFDGGDGMTFTGNTNINVGAFTIMFVASETTVLQNVGFLVLRSSTATNDYDNKNSVVLNGADALSWSAELYSDSGTRTRSFATGGKLAWATIAAMGVATPAIFIDGVKGESSAGVTGTGIADGGIVIGARWLSGALDVSYGLNGEIGEIVLYNRVLTDIERLSAEMYLKEKWGTP